MSEKISKLGREIEKQFLDYSLEFLDKQWF